MILHDMAIAEWAKDNVTPFEPKNVGPASLDLTWAGEIIKVSSKYIFPGIRIDVDEQEFLETENYISHLVATKNAILGEGNYILLSHEKVNLANDMSALLIARSSLSRIGAVFSVGFFDPAYNGHASCALYIPQAVHVPLIVGQKLCQLVFIENEIPMRNYQQKGGRYRDKEAVSKGL